MRARLFAALLAVAGLVATAASAGAQGPSAPAIPSLAIPTAVSPQAAPGSITLNFSGLEDRGRVATALKVMALMTVLALAPSILIMLTSFTRIVVVLSFIKRALSLTEVPPQQVVIGLSLFLTFFVMAPTWNGIKRDGIDPYMAGKIGEGEAWRASEGHIRQFLFRNTREADLGAMFALSGLPKPTSLDDVPTYVAIPAFLMSELKTAFSIGFIVFLPFLIIDMVVASILLSMGMMMLPPVIVSLPFKIILFVLVDGWNLIVGELIRSFA